MNTAIQQDNPARVRELEQAFQAFNQTSQALETAYRELERRAAKLAEELAEARSEKLRQLAETERLATRLRGLLETLPAGVVVVDSGGRIQEANPGAHELLGGGLTGQDWMAVRAAALTGTDAPAGEMGLQDGRRVSVATRALGENDGHIVLLSDVTETRRLQELLARAERLSEMGEMTARLAHQTRTPLATAILYASQLVDSAADEDVQRRAGRILSRLHRLERMVNDMLVFARGGKSGTESIDVAELLYDVAATVAPQTGAARLQVAALDALAPLNANREALSGALINLVTNALQADVSGGTVELAAATASNGDIELQVLDRGPGIPESVREQIFEPFFTTRADGTGLGLAVADSVARAHGGRMLVRTRNGGGAIVGLRLPQTHATALHSGSNPVPLSNVVLPFRKAEQE